MDDELVERDDQGQYIVTAPSSMYKQMVQMKEGDEETGMSQQMHERKGRGGNGGCSSGCVLMV